MRYGVFDNNRPARYPEIKIHSSWKKNEYDTFADAHAYANKWLGEYGGVVLLANTPWDYSGYGDVIEIRELP